MRVMQRLFVLPAILMLALATCWWPARPVLAQSTGLSGMSTDQTDAFSNLSSDQQQAVLRSLMGGSNGQSGGLSSSMGSATGTLSGTDNPNNARQMDLNNTMTRRPPSDDEEQPEPAIPVLRGDDWVIVEIGFQLGPRALIPNAQNGTGGSGMTQQQLQAMMAAGSAAALNAANTNAPQQGGSAAEQQAGATTQDEMTEEDRKRLQSLIDLIQSKNPYQLSHDGTLTLPGFAPIALLGLNEEQATLRLKVEPGFKRIDIRLTRLPLKKVGVEALKPFGYDLFDRNPSTFAPVTNVPVPTDYVMGPGDQLEVQLYGGGTNRTLRLSVSRDGRISFPELGPIYVSGQRFDSVKANIEQRVEHQMIGTHANVSMGDTRSIRVFVLGDVRQPGSYTISGLGTITSALYAAGGIKRIGSLRQIELKRQGQLVRRLDLYDLLIRGDTTDDAKLLPGDVVFIPPVGNTISIDGEVRRPAIYEIKNEASIAAAVALAGGLTPQADLSDAMLTRIDEAGRRTVLHVDLTGSQTAAMGVRNGDTLRVARLRPTLDSGIMLAGHVYTPGAYAYHPGIRLSDILHSVDDLRPNADLHYILIRRELPPDRRITVLSADLAAALLAPHSKSDVELMPRDRITVFDLGSGREEIIQPVLDELRLQSNSAHPLEVVHVDGRVKEPGAYPLESGMTVADLVRAGGGLSAAAYGGNAELTRYDVVNGETRRTQLININLAAALRGDPASNLELRPFDNLSIKEVSQWQAQQTVTLLGEVRFPGKYAVKSGETLKSVIQRAGGLTDYAFADGSVFTREELRLREQEQLDALVNRMKSDLAALALESTNSANANAAASMTVGQTLLAQVKATKAVGRLVIDLGRLLREPVASPDDVYVRDGDQLIVPKFQQQVTVIGEVQTVTSHLYNPNFARDDYISLSGGTTQRADRGRIYVVRANGNVVAKQGNRWFDNGRLEIKPGDTIVVPLDMEKMPALTFWQAVTSIIYNVAIAAAAVHSF